MAKSKSIAEKIKSLDEAIDRSEKMIREATNSLNNWGYFPLESLLLRNVTMEGVDKLREHVLYLKEQRSLLSKQTKG